MSKHFIRSLLKVITSIGVGLLVALVPPAASSQGTAHRDALESIADFADRICATIPLEGSAREVELTGEASAELSRFLQHFAEIGVVGSGRFVEQEFQGLLRQDLAHAIASGQDCRFGVFERLVDRLLPDQSSGDSRPNAATSSVDSIPLFSSIGGIVPGETTLSDYSTLMPGFNANIRRKQFDERHGNYYLDYHRSALDIGGLPPEVYRNVIFHEGVVSAVQIGFECRGDRNCARQCILVDDYFEEKFSRSFDKGIYPHRYYWHDWDSFINASYNNMSDGFRVDFELFMWKLQAGQRVGQRDDSRCNFLLTVLSPDVAARM